ncbi:MAG: hypothetical protein AB1813_07575 [Verrucomicrobiota bacterium]|jgi:type II secretory pathway component GspD/PulD (secretin)
MKNNLAGAVLASLLVLLVAATALFSYSYIRSVQKMQHLQVQSAMINFQRNRVQALANDTLEYSKRNPAIDPLLQSIGLKPKTDSGTGAKPSKSP